MNAVKNLEEKYLRLQQILREMGSLGIGFSGGVDSTFLLKVAHDVLGDKAVAITAHSVIHPADEFDEARQLAQAIGAPHRGFEMGLENEEFLQNDPNRCYYCKKAVFSKIGELARQEGLNYVAEGTNFDDLGDYRPGMRAVKELAVRSPLLEAGLTKQEIRELSRRLGLPTWDKPAFACLTSRIPYGERITADKLVRIDGAEQYLRSCGMKQFRARYHDAQTVRIEVLPADMPYLLEHREEVVARLKALGFTYITLDLIGYRTGSMNEVLTDEVKKHGQG